MSEGTEEKATETTAESGSFKLTPEQVALLREPFPQEALSADSSRGFELTSIKAAYIIERLNNVFGFGGWKYRYVPFTREDNEILTEVTLSVKDNENNWYSIPNAGGHDMVSNRITDARKSAITDGINKCASFLEIGIDVFKGNVKPAGGSKTKTASIQKKTKTSDSENQTCPKCGKPMKERTGKKGKFMGCSGYPECGHTGSISKSLATTKKQAPPAEPPKTESTLSEQQTDRLAKSRNLGERHGDII
jgi:hypothetical protein